MKQELLHSPKKILLIKLRKLGDVLSTTPAARQIRILYPRAEIHFLTEPLGASIYKYSKKVDRVITLSREPSWIEYIRLCIKVRSEKYDIIVDFYDHNKTALIAMLSGSKHIFGFSKTGERTLAYNHVFKLTENDTKYVYSANHQLKLIKELGANTIDNKVEFEITDEVRNQAEEFALRNKINDKTIAFCVLSERSMAQVPVSLLIDIGNHLLVNGFSLYFVYGPNEKHLAQKVYDQMTNKEACLIDFDVPSIPVQRAILEHCCLFVGNDGGNKHLAVAADIPTIGLFYSDQPPVWTPDDKSRHRYIQTRENYEALEEFIKLFSQWSYDKLAFLGN